MGGAWAVPRACCAIAAQPVESACARNARGGLRAWPCLRRRWPRVNTRPSHRARWRRREVEVCALQAGQHVYEGDLPDLGQVCDVTPRSTHAHAAAIATLVQKKRAMS